MYKNSVCIIILITGNHTVAAVKLDENYEEMAAALISTFSEIESLISNKKITVDGHDYPVEVFLVGDYKVICQFLYDMYSKLTSFLNPYSVFIDDVGAQCCKQQLCVRMVHGSQGWSVKFCIKHYKVIV